MSGRGWSLQHVVRVEQKIIQHNNDIAVEYNKTVKFPSFGNQQKNPRKKITLFFLGDGDIGGIV